MRKGHGARNHLADARRGLLVSGVSLSLFVILTSLVVFRARDGIQTLDSAWLSFMTAIENPVFTAAGDAIGHAVDPALVLGATVVLVIALLVMRRGRDAALLAVATVIGFVSVYWIQHAVGRPGPPHPLDPTTHVGASVSDGFERWLRQLGTYPSGHVGCNTVFWLTLAFIFTAPLTRARRGALTAVALFIALVALTRTYMHDHWLTDTVGGALLGVGIAVGTAALLDLTGDHGRRPLPPVEVVERMS
ncbi:phosphatase PAP2 family protein [Streptomyces sp. NPDC019396]|uniref:phosphatase PAP2 family protein n=1 Tax=Streptomyces sp. NPDC019396 TaxID=3154687 RepID=UPI0033DFCC23